MHVLRRRVSPHVSFWLAVQPEFIHLAADPRPALPQGRFDRARTPVLSRWFATPDEMLPRPNGNAAEFPRHRSRFENNVVPMK
jgi:hypothetical protein